MSISAEQNHPLPPPDPKVPRDWAAQIAEAKKARAMGRALRRGKHVTFADRRAHRVTSE